QYTLQLNGVDRDALNTYLAAQKIPSMIYYPVPGHRQPMFTNAGIPDYDLRVTDRLTECVISLPVHTEMDEEQLSFITKHVLSFINN
ncbi:MAG: regulatory protein, partial [Sediminibacterium sp.]|nr:regulatory protein [Sediminibacterium sp.]